MKEREREREIQANESSFLTAVADSSRIGAGRTGNVSHSETGIAETVPNEQMCQAVLFPVINGKYLSPNAMELTTDTISLYLLTFQILFRH